MIDVRADTTAPEALIGLAMKLAGFLLTASTVLNPARPTAFRVAAAVAAVVLGAGLGQSVLRLSRRYRAPS